MEIFYNLQIDEENYQKSGEFGLIVGEYHIKEEDMTVEYALLLFKLFLVNNQLI
ncbi:hypothetical protein [Peribacillus sp. ACCC06369]|uniref:hypothetical protein n=1 Tax=Peribacillus sp. ACCC06369 TaxID=3055860 RepID=UPI0025A22C6C|nr:hypothetical protein [Peribacillus sp. ACCC06369]MDM5357112.1 hypothetical protein [Peribacillus sp. ACCC06369]